MLSIYDDRPIICLSYIYGYTPKIYFRVFQGFNYILVVSQITRVGVNSPDTHIAMCLPLFRLLLY